ncbi:MAG: urease accessory protein UreE [Cellvibrionaceae bacterium]
MKIFNQLVTVPVDVSNQNDAIEQVRLSFDDRKRGRLKVTTLDGDEVGIQIERGQVLRDGTWLSNDAGELLQVLALPEEVTTAYVADATLFARGCYHLGNRHVPLQVGEGFLRYQRDYVLDDMLKGLGIEPQYEEAIFEPENGAYAPGTGHHHHHGENHEHSHHSHDHAHHH